MTLLQLKHIDKYYNLDNKEKFHALKDINIEFSRGELVSIIGESGSGKSTMMNLIGGLDSDFQGELLLEGKDIGKFSESQLDEYRKNKVGFVFQSCNLIPHLSILDNVTIALTLSNIGKEQRVEKAKKALREVGLERHIDKKPNQLSGGEKQRVAIARALINDPEIILADEPTGALDSDTTTQVLNIIKAIADRGRLVIIVTHSQRVASYSSRVVKIFDGEIVEDNKKDNSSKVEVDKSAQTYKGKQDLSFFSAIKLAANNMKQKLVRNILVSLGVSIGIMSIVLVLSMGNGLKAYFRTMINDFMNPLVVEVTMPLKVNPDDPTAAMRVTMGEAIPFQEENIEELSKIKGVVKVEKGASFMYMPGSSVIKQGDKQSDIVMLNSVSEALTDKNLKLGKMPKKNEILINQAIADKLGPSLIGTTVELNLASKGKIIKGEFVVSGLYTMDVNDSNADSVAKALINFDDMEAMFKEAGVDLVIGSIYLKANSENEASRIKSQVKHLGYRGSIQEIMGDRMLTMLNILTLALAGIAGISLLVSSIMILVVLHISVVERTKEIGLLRAIGARRKDIKRIFVSEAFLIGIASGVIGVLGAYAISIVVNSAMNKSYEMEVMNLTLSYALVGMGISTGVSMLSGLFPANKAAKLDPVESLRTE